VWRNQTSEVLARVAESLDDFRARFAYPFDDPQVRDLAAEVAIIAQWDDHETHNNWWPGQILADDRYRERSASVLAARARQALFEWIPIGRDQRGPGTPINRVLHHGPHLDVVVVDLRSFRTATDRAGDDGAPMLGRDQAAWLVEALAGSRATWKIVACDQPLGLIIPDGDDDPTRQEGWALPGEPVRGREQELAWVLAELHRRGVDRRGVADRRRALRRRAPLRSGARHRRRVHAVLGVRRRPAPRRHLRPQPARSRPSAPRRASCGRRRPAPATSRRGTGCRASAPSTLDGASRALTVRLHGPAGEEKFAVTLPPTGR
jgi:hypothetical protein